MALISAKTILTSLSLFHITLAWFFYTNPATIADQALVWVIGDAMGMPYTPLFATPSPAASLLAVVLLALGLSDLTSLSMPEEVWLIHHWGSQAPIRATIFGFLSAWVYITNPRAVPGPDDTLMSAPKPAAHTSTVAYGTSSGADALRNRVFFVFAFLEFLGWLWAWVTIREDTRAAVMARHRQRKD